MNEKVCKEVTQRIFEEFQWICNRFKQERILHNNPDDIVCAKLYGHIAGLQTALEHLGMYNLAEYLPWDIKGVNINYTIPVILK